MKKKIKVLLIGVIILCIIFLFGVWLYEKNYTLLNPYASLKAVSYENVLKKDEEYYVYIYLKGCPDCIKAEPYILEFAKNNTLFVLDVDNAIDRERYDWNSHYMQYDIEIGTVDDQGNIIYYNGESEKKYLDATQKDEFGHKMRYEVKIADEEYIEKNSKAEIGKVYASLVTPIIDYSNIEDGEHIVIPAMPIMFHIKSGIILDYYYDAPEIIDFVNQSKTN